MSRSAEVRVVPTGPVLIVSPHLDDAVLSAFAFLQRGQTTVLTVFCGTPGDDVSSEWDRKLGHVNGNEIMRRRLAEDDAVLASLGVPTIRLPLLEWGYRRREMPSCDVASLRDAVVDWVEATNGEGVVLAPAGAGGREHLLYRVRWHSRLPLLRIPGGGVPHPDHIAVRDVVVPEVLAAGHPVVLYEEFPYRWSRRGDHSVSQYASKGLPRPARFELRVDPCAKARAVSNYRSQTPELFRPWVRDIANVMPASERYWLVAPT
jgi:LmbE family N-acetylglucosaminyl deacetylase